MPRTNRITNAEFPLHLTGRCINRDWFGQPLESVWPIFCDHLYFCAIAFDVEIYSFVLMQNHFHLLARFPQNNLSKAMAYLMRETSRQICKNAERINSTYGSRFHSSMIKDEIHFRNVYKYNYRNPVSAGVVKYAEEYSFSTLAGLLGQRPLSIPLQEDTILFENPEETLRWLNRTPDENHEREFRLALRRPTLSFALNRKNKKESVWQKELL